MNIKITFLFILISLTFFSKGSQALTLINTNSQPIVVRIYAHFDTQEHANLIADNIDIQANRKMSYDIEGTIQNLMNKNRYRKLNLLRLAISFKDKNHAKACATKKYNYLLDEKSSVTIDLDAPNSINRCKWDLPNSK